MQAIHKPLHKRCDFWAAIGLPIAIALIVLTTIIIAEPKLTSCFTSACYAFAFQLFKIPIALLALPLPLAGIVAAYHRSIETQAQIEITIQNNTFSNYLKHRDEFGKLFDAAKPVLPIANFQFGSVQRLYREIFSENSYTKLSFTPNEIDMECFFNEVDKIISFCEGVLVSEHPEEQEIFEYFRQVVGGLELVRVICGTADTYFDFEGSCLEFPFEERSHVDYFLTITLVASRISLFCGSDKIYGSDSWEVGNADAFEDFIKKHGARYDPPTLRTS